MGQQASSAALLRADARREPVGVLEIKLAQITGAAVGVRALDADGTPIAFTFPAEQAEAFIGAAQQAAKLAAQARERAGEAIDIALPVVHPQSFQVVAANDLDAVVIAFDPGTPNAQMFAIPVDAAMRFAGAVAQAAQAQRAKKPRLIIPNG